MLFENDLAQNVSWKIKYEDLQLDQLDELEEDPTPQRPLDKLFNFNTVS